MANCPKCGVHLKVTDWRQHCPHCGANIVVYDLQERLMQQADIAEVQHYHFQKKIDRLKASFIGSKLAVVRIITSFVPVFALLLPLIKCRLNPAFGDFDGNVSAVTIYNGVDTIGSPGFLSSDKLLTAALILLAVSILLWLIHFFLLMMACSKRAKVRAAIIDPLLVIASAAPLILFLTDKSGAVLTGKPSIGIFLYIALQILNAAIDFAVLKQGIPVHHKQCFVGGIPIEEYFEMKETMSAEEIRQEQYRRLQAIQDEKEAEIARDIAGKEDSSVSPAADDIEEKEAENDV
ncbi:MAG: zinc ribbon domain-containing protein [Clostridia bacterium]|nr:zinc ribbon domain-containing protein [Clostridia bacterium]